MKNCTYFVNSSGLAGPEPCLTPGYGFRRDGAWRGQPLPEFAAGLLVDDRFLPDRRGLTAALRSLAQWKGLLIFDLERPRHPMLAQLIAGLEEKALVIPPAYADLPHAAALVGPWQGKQSFESWLSACRERFGALMLDGAPLRSRAAPSACWEPWKGPLPARGFLCQGLGVIHRRQDDGSILFWDTRETYARRLKDLKLPVILFRQDWEVLPKMELDFASRDCYNG